VTNAELLRIARLNGSAKPNGSDTPTDGTDGAAVFKRGAITAGDAVTRSAALAARAVHDRARFQHNQAARLRRRRFEVLKVPFVFGGELDLAAVRRIAEHLGRRQGGP